MDPLLFTLIAAGSSTAFLFSTEMGRDAVARTFADASSPIHRIVGARPDDVAAVRRLHVYRVVPWKGSPAVVLAPTQVAAAQAILDGEGMGGSAECLLRPHRVIRVPVPGEGRRDWYLVGLPRWLAFLGAGPCEHGGVHGPAGDPALMSRLLDERIAAFKPEGPLEQAIVNAARDPAARPALHRALLASDIYAITVEAEGTGPDGKPTVSYPLVDGPGGEKLLPMYSNLARFQPVPGLKLLKMPFTGFVHHIWAFQPTPIVLNPNSPLPFEFGNEELAYLDGMVKKREKATAPDGKA